MRTKSKALLPAGTVAAAATVLICASACDGLLPTPADTAVIDGSAPALVSWSGAMDCCGEDPHPVHGAALADGTVVMVGKAGAGDGRTAGFVTRWLPPDGPAGGRFVDGDGQVLQGAVLLAADSALLQVVEVGEVLVAVGFEASSPTAPARGIALALDPTSLEVSSRLEVSAPQADESAVLESVAVTPSGHLLLGGSWGASRDELEGFKSYGNVTGGRGVLIELDPDDWTTSNGGADPVTPEDLGAAVREIPEVHSVKSMRALSSGRIAAVGSDPGERSGLIWIEQGLTGHLLHPFDDGRELTDVAVFERPGQDEAVVLVGHGGDGTIDGHAKLVDGNGEVLWSTAFGNPGVATEDAPAEGLAPDRFIFDECWGAAPAGDLMVVACGTGIEGCDAVAAEPEERELCRTDPRRSWRSYLVGLSGDGDVVWSRSDTFVDEAGEAAESAAEFVVVSEQADIYAIMDQNFGVGLARFAEERAP